MREGQARRARASRWAAAAGPLRDVAVGGAHLAVLSAFALAQPLFDLLSKNAEFFVVRGSTRWDIVAFAVSVTVVPPLVLAAVELLARLLDPRLQLAVHLLFVAGLTGLFAVQALKRAHGLSSTLMLVGAAALGVAGALAYWRARPARLFLTVLTPSPLLFLCLFLFVSPVSKLILGQEAQASAATAVTTSPVKPRIVMVVMDEFPTTSLMDADGKIDRAAYPNFAAFARRATWFRNSTTVGSSTNYAVPAILTGLYPKKGQLPSLADHPNNLFTLLGRLYRLNVYESETHLCPRELCRSTTKPQRFTSRMRSLYSDLDVIYLHIVAPPKLEARLPDVSASWLNFRAGGTDAGANSRYRVKGRHGGVRFWTGRRAEWERFVRSLKPSKRPELDFVHIVLPHSPFEYFPSGVQYAQIPGFGSPRDFDTWKPDQVLVLQTYERHLLQVRFMDRLFGELLGRLRRLGIFDQSLIVVTADEGSSYRAGDRRRGPTPTNLADIAYVPLFVKVPGQRQGAVDDAYVQGIDVLPTIAESLDISIPWRVDGHSAFSGPHADTVRFAGEGVSIDAGLLVKQRDAAVKRKVAFFGSEKGSRGLFAIGPHHELVGRLVSALPVAPSSAASATINSRARARLQAVRPGSGFLPALIGGVIHRGRAGMTLAIAVNGRIATTTRSYSISGNGRFAALVPAPVFRRGVNHVQVLEVETSDGALRLRSLGNVS